MVTRLLVVDDHPLMRLGVADVVSAFPDLALVGEVLVAGAAEAVQRLDPDVIVVGVHRSAGTTLGTAARFIRPGRGVVVLDEDEDPARMLAALDHGFAAYVSMTGPADDMVSAIRHAAVYPGAFCAEGLADAIRAAARESVLSTRERQVLVLLRDGHTSAAIAARLGVSDSSVKTYLARIYGKLEVSNRSQALVTALRRGLLPEPV